MLLARSPDGRDLRWVPSAGVARLFLPTYELFTSQYDLQRLSHPHLVQLLGDFDASTLEELWKALWRNVTICAPGDLRHEFTPARLPTRPARLARRHLYQLTERAKTFEGTKQARMIIAHLWYLFGLTAFDDTQVEQVLGAPSFAIQWYGRQLPHKVFHWYRPTYIEKGAMVVLGTPPRRVRLNDTSTNELYRLKSKLSR